MPTPPRTHNAYQDEVYIARRQQLTQSPFATTTTSTYYRAFICHMMQLPSYVDTAPYATNVCMTHTRPGHNCEYDQGIAMCIVMAARASFDESASAEAAQTQSHI